MSEEWGRLTCVGASFGASVRGTRGAPRPFEILSWNIGIFRGLSKWRNGFWRKRRWGGLWGREEGTHHVLFNL